MLKLTLANDAVVEIGEYEDNAISNREQLCSVFAGTSAIFYEDDEADVEYMDFDVSDDDYFLLDGYIRITKAEWSFAESGYVGCDTFKQFVQSEMNRYCDGDATWCFDLIEHGCASGMVSSLIYTSDIIKVLSEHARDIQYKVDEIATNVGNDMSFLFKDGFTFDRLVWMCFEESVRDVLRKLELDDV